MRSSTAEKLRRARSLATTGSYTSLKVLAKNVRLSESTLRGYGVTLTGTRPSDPATSELPPLNTDVSLGLGTPQPEDATTSGWPDTDAPPAAPGTEHGADDDSGGGDDTIIGHNDVPRPKEPDPRSGGSAIAAAAATAGVGGAVGGSAAALATGAGGVGLAFAGGAVGIAAGPIIAGGALVGVGAVLALKGLGVPVDKVAAKAAKAVKDAAEDAAPVVRRHAAAGAAAVGGAIAISVPAGKRAAAGAGDGIRQMLGHRKPNMSNAVSQYARKDLYETQQRRCNGCGNTYQEKDLTVDHIVPVSKGGTNDIANLQLLCHNCNSIKGNRSMDYLRRRIRRRDT